MAGTGKGPKFYLPFGLLLLALLLFLSPEAAAQDFALPRLEIRLALLEDGSLRVEEERTITFIGQVNGFFQYIPVDPAMDIRNIEVREAGKPYTFNPGSSPGPPGTFFVVKKPDSVFIDWSLQAYNETRTFVLTYHIDSAVLLHEDTAELYMKFVGEDWEKGVEEVSVYLALPGKAGREDLKVFGHGPLQGRVAILDDGRVSWQVRSLPRKTYLEGRVLFPGDLVPGASRQSGRPALEKILREEERLARQADRLRLLARLEGLTGVLVLAAGLLSAFLFWLKYGREYRPDFDGDYYRDLPGEYSPAELGILWRFGKTTTGDLTATLLDLARKGYVTLEEETRQSRGILRNRPETHYVIKRKKEDQTALSEHEKQLLDFLFRQVSGFSSEVSFKDIEVYARVNQRSFLMFWTGWQSQIKAQGFQLGFFDPLTKQGKVLEILLGLAFWVLSFLAFAGSFYIVFVALGLAGLVLIISGAFLRRRSQRGVNDFARWRAFRRFLLHFSELDRSGIPSLAVWEHYLVYAVALGVAKEVLRQLQVVYPDLRDGSYRFGAHWYYMSASTGSSLSPMNALDNLANGLQRSFHAATSVSSSKGGGGGFSGGGGRGFGGGGGGVR